jgi:hypothetical protein
MYMQITDMRSSRTLALSMLMVVFLPFVASAQTEGDVARSEALVTRGVELRRNGDDEGALRVFTEAYELAHTSRALAQMGLAEQALGHFVNAEAHLVEALSSTTDAWINSRREALEDALATLRTRLGTLELRGGVDGAQVRLDGVVVAHVPITSPIRSPVGTFRLEVVAPGYYPFVRTITIVAEGTTRETVEMTETPREGTSTPVDPEATSIATRRRRSGALAYTLGGTGIASLGVSVGMLVLQRNTAAEWNSDACLANGTREQTCGPKYDRAIASGRASAATLVVGTGLVATGVILLLTRPSEPQGTETSVACGGVIGRTTSASCSWRF